MLLQYVSAVKPGALKNTMLVAGTEAVGRAGMWLPVLASLAQALLRFGFDDTGDKHQSVEPRSGTRADSATGVREQRCRQAFSGLEVAIVNVAVQGLLFTSCAHSVDSCQVGT